MNIFSFKGRAKRAEYCAITIPLGILLESSTWIIPDSAYNNPFVVAILYIAGILCFCIGIATSTRRCHDLGYNGFWQLMPFFFILLLFSKGQDGENKYDIK